MDLEAGTGSPVSPPDSPLPRRVEKPWGHELWWALTQHYAAKILHVKAGHRLSLQYHEHKDETSYLLTGRLVLLKGPTESAIVETELEPGASWRTLPGEVHSIHALEDSAVLEVSTPEVDDVVRLHDAYGRAGTTGH